MSYGPESIDAGTFNNLFVTRLDTPDGIDKAAQAGGAFVRERLREVSFLRGIIPPEYVTKADCQRSVNHDLLVKIVDIEPQSSAAAVNFKGKALERYIENDRYEIPFFKVESEKFSKNEAELLAYDYPVTKVIEENSVKDIQKVEDGKFIEFIDAVIVVNGKDVTPAENGPATSLNLTTLFKAIDADELSVGCVLMHKADWDDFMVQRADVIGSSLASEILVNGYKYNTILGHKLVVTIKTSVVPVGTLYCFTDPKYLGNFYILNDTKFYIEKRADIVTWQTWEYVGLGIGNLRACAKMQLES
ncbi:MAG: hypothetical protein DRP42_00625 [Tenericutes bacterium]|nr:MAG: hypothetical protein DRP42_00625 [Mycoplasmatota bacterium]